MKEEMKAEMEKVNRRMVDYIFGMAKYPDTSTKPVAKKSGKGKRDYRMFVVTTGKGSTYPVYMSGGAAKEVANGTLCKVQAMKGHHDNPIMRVA